MKKITLLLIAIIVLVLPGCMKSVVPEIPVIPVIPDDTSGISIPVITGIGTPVGNSVSKMIGPGGGFIASADGMLELNIPAGALSVNTNITIQPTTNECPGGLGLVYDLLPNGTKFNIPATLTFHYSDDSLEGTDPYFLFIAYQDSLLGWKADVTNRDIDTVGKKVMLDISHFTPYGKGQSNNIKADPRSLHRSQSSSLKAVFQADPPKGNDDIVNLIADKPLSNVKNWRVNGILGGNTIVGTVVGSRNSAKYFAPESIPKKKKVTITAEYSVPVTFYIKRKAVTRQNALVVGATITLLPTYAYDIKIEYSEIGTNPCFADNYTDSATMHVDIINDNDVIISNIANYQPSVYPVTGNDPLDVETCKWIPDEFGLVNIASATGTIIPEGDDQFVLISCNDGGQTITAKWMETSIGSGAVSYSGALKLPGYPPSIHFILNGEPQVNDLDTPPNATGYSAHGHITITPRKE